MVEFSHIKDILSSFNVIVVVVTFVLMLMEICGRLYVCPLASLDNKQNKRLSFVCMEMPCIIYEIQAIKKNIYACVLYVYANCRSSFIYGMMMAIIQLNERNKKTA